MDTAEALKYLNGVLGTELVEVGDCKTAGSHYVGRAFPGLYRKIYVGFLRDGNYFKVFPSGEILKSSAPAGKETRLARAACSIRKERE